MADEKETKAKKAAPKKAAAPKADAKPAAAKAPKKADAPKAEKPAAAEKKAAAPKKSASGKTVTITQIGSPIGRRNDQRATLVGLGLNKMHRTRTLEDTPAVRGMISKVRHLVKIEDAA